MLQLRKRLIDVQGFLPCGSQTRKCQAGGARGNLVARNRAEDQCSGGQQQCGAQQHLPRRACRNADGLGWSLRFAAAFLRTEFDHAILITASNPRIRGDLPRLKFHGPPPEFPRSIKHLRWKQAGAARRGADFIGCGDGAPLQQGQRFVRSEMPDGGGHEPFVAGLLQSAAAQGLPGGVERLCEFDLQRQAQGVGGTALGQAMQRRRQTGAGHGPTCDVTGQR